MFNAKPVMNAQPLPSRHRPVWMACLVVVIALSWIVMIEQYRAGHVHTLSFISQVCGSANAVWDMGLAWLSGWTVMVLAMMLPPALPLLRVVEKLAIDEPQAWRLILVCTLAFLIAWVLAGAALWLAGSVTARGLDGQIWLRERPWLLGGVAAILAGLYQFTPLKMACLTACRSPASVAMTRWQADAPLRSAAWIGLRYGGICVMCCWALMLLTLIVGAMAMPIMVLTSVFMMLERVLPSIRPLIPLQAALAVLVGVALLMGWLPPGLLLV
jgi:predicted metal-binding membrane protein